MYGCFGHLPAWRSFSPAAISSWRPPTCTVPGPPRRLIGPRDPSLNGEVDLEGPGPVPVASQRARDSTRHPIAGDPCRCGRRDVEHDDVRRVELGERPTLTPVSNAASSLEQRDHRAADRVVIHLRRLASRIGARLCRGSRRLPRTSARRTAGRRGRRCRRTARAPARRTSGERAPPPARGVQAESGQLEGVLGHVEHRAHEVGGDVMEALGERSEHRLPPPAVIAEPVGGHLHRLVGRGAGTPVERVRVLNLWPAPGQPVLTEVEAAGERRVDARGERPSIRRGAGRGASARCAGTAAEVRLLRAR